MSQSRIYYETVQVYMHDDLFGTAVQVHDIGYIMDLYNRPYIVNCWISRDSLLTNQMQAFTRHIK